MSPSGVRTQEIRIVACRTSQRPPGTDTASGNQVVTDIAYQIPLLLDDTLRHRVIKRKSTLVHTVSISGQEINKLLVRTGKPHVYRLGRTCGLVIGKRHLIVSMQLARCGKYAYPGHGTLCASCQRSEVGRRMLRAKEIVTRQQEHYGMAP